MSSDSDVDAVPTQGEAPPTPAPSPDAGGEVDTGDADLPLWDDGGEEGEPGDGEASEEVSADDALKAVPESADGYALPEIEGVEWNDADKAVFGSVFEAAHEGGIPQAGINALGKWYATQVVEAKRIEKERDANDVTTVRNAMVEALGEDGFKAEIGKVQQQFAAMPHGLGKEIRHARLPNGKKLGHDPRFIHFLANLEHAGPPSDQAREAELVKMMRDDPREYAKTGQKELAALRAAKNGGPAVEQPALNAYDTKRKAELKRMMSENPAQYEKTGRAEFAAIIEREEAARRR